MFKVGDRVSYSAQFCRSIGAYSGNIPHARGTVTEVSDFGGGQLVTVEWVKQGTMRVLSCNLAHVGPNSRFCSI